jgi:hypothetical protein
MLVLRMSSATRAAGRRRQAEVKFQTLVFTAPSCLPLSVYDSFP